MRSVSLKSAVSKVALTVATTTAILVPAVVSAPVASAAPAAASAVSSSAVASVAASTDPTVTRRARASRAARGNISVRTWANSATARRVARRESGGNCRAVSRNGTYRGKWQMNSAFWRAYGGRRYASTPDRASCAQQDVVAHRGWVASWWRPWSTF